MSRALAFLADPALAESVLPSPGQSLDLEGFVREPATLYLIAESRGEKSPVAPCSPAWPANCTTSPRSREAGCPAAGSTRPCSWL